MGYPTKKQCEVSGRCVCLCVRGPLWHWVMPLTRSPSTPSSELVSRLSWTDIFLTPMIIVAMIIGVVIGEFAPNVHANLNRGNLIGVSAPLVVGLILMMVPILTK